MNDVKFFIYFLKENDCYKQFIENCHKMLDGPKNIRMYDAYDAWFYNRWKNYSSVIEYLCDNESNSERYLDYAFRWMLTSQGSSFWNKINDKWVDCLRHKK